MAPNKFKPVSAQVTQAAWQKWNADKSRVNEEVLFHCILPYFCHIGGKLGFQFEEYAEDYLLSFRKTLRRYRDDRGVDEHGQPLPVMLFATYAGARWPSHIQQVRMREKTARKNSIPFCRIDSENSSFVDSIVDTDPFTEDYRNAEFSSSSRHRPDPSRIHADPFEMLPIDLMDLYD